MFERILRELAAATGPVSLWDLGRRLEIEPSALAGMLDFLVRKGRLRVSGGDALPDCGSCGQRGACPYAVALPKSYALVDDAAPA